MNNDSTILSSEPSTPSQVPADSATQTAAESSTIATSRRAFLTFTLAGCAAGCAALAGCGAPSEGGSGTSAPAGKNFAPLVKATRTGDTWLVAGAGDLAPDTAVQFIAAGEPVLVIATSNGVKAFSGRCTHLGCAVEWHGDEKRIVCPCHASKFDTTGKVLNGPAEKPLPVYAVKKQGSDAVVTVKA